jgi:hypothetical protein
MSGRGGRQGIGGHGGRGNSHGHGGCGRGNYYSGVGAVVKHKGLCAALSNHVFDYGQKGATDQMRTTWEKIIVHHVGTIYTTVMTFQTNFRTRRLLSSPNPSMPKHAQACPSSHTQAAIPKHTQAAIPKHTQQAAIPKHTQAYPS